MGKEAFAEMAETLGKFAGMLVKELGGTGKQMVEGFKKGYREGAEEKEPVGAGVGRDEQGK